MRRVWKRMAINDESKVKMGVAQLACDLEKLILRIGSHRVTLRLTVNYTAPKDKNKYGVLDMKADYVLGQRRYEEHIKYAHRDNQWFKVFNG